MVKIQLTITAKLKKQMDKFSDVNWNKVIAEAIEEKTQMLEKEADIKIRQKVCSPLLPEY